MLGGMAFQDPASVSVDNLQVTNQITGNLAFASGNGIDFSATGDSGGMTSELLDDYEEGTWTPTLVGGTTSGTTTYDIQSGSYVKIGKTVICQLSLNIASKTGTGDIKISLPFTATGRFSGSPLIFNFTTSNQQVNLYGPSGNFAFISKRNISDGAAALGQMSDITDDFQCYGIFSFEVA